MPNFKPDPCLFPTRILQRGLQRIWVALLHGRSLPMGRFLPEPWPTTMPPRKKAKKAQAQPPPQISDGDTAASAPEAVVCTKTYP